MQQIPWPEATVRVTPPSLFTDGWAWRLNQEPPLSTSEAVGLTGSGTVLAVVAHPDDETLAMGATLAAVAADGVAAHVVCLTQGEAAVRHLGLQLPGLGARRISELADACRSLGVRCHGIGSWPDGRLVDAVHDAATHVSRLIDEIDPDVLLTTWRHDPHPDHRAVSEVVLATASGRRVVEMPVWAVHWTDPATVDVDVRRVEATTEARQAKARALASYTSQTRPLREGLYPVLPHSVVNWPYECVVLP